MAATAAGVVLVGVLASPAAAQPVPTGYVSLFVDYLPNRAGTVEGRIRIFAEEKIDISSGVRLTASAFAEGALARRPVEPGLDVTRTAVIREAVVRVQDANIELVRGRTELVAGLGRVVWGRLDEIQPTDVINPLDVSRFFFDGRSEARLPVALVRGRFFLNADSSIEAIYVPVFRRGRFDQIDEPTAPFAIDAPAGIAVCLAIGCPVLPVDVVAEEPSVRLASGQGGVRINATTSRVDWSVSAYRGFEPFAIYGAGPVTAGRATILGSHPRFTMLGTDFETVRGLWGIRGEAAVFVEDTFQSLDLVAVEGASLDAGVGVDRRAGSYRLSGTVLFRREAYDAPVAGDDSRSDLSLVFAADRTFARERYRLRAFSVANLTEGSGFARVIAAAELRTSVALEGSAGWFVGRGADVVGRFFDRDFAYVRLKYLF